MKMEKETNSTMESGSVTIIRSVARVFKVHVFLVPSSLLVDNMLRKKCDVLKRNTFLYQY